MNRLSAFRLAIPLFALVQLLGAQSPLQPFIAFGDSVVALTHVRLIDGTGAPARSDQTVIVDRGNISAVGSTASTPVPAGARTLDLSGHTVFPGLIGMHEHLFYPSPGGAPLYNEQAISAPALYLASGVTTARTAGSLEPYADLNTKAAVEAGNLPGPDFDITAPYIQGPGGYSVQMPVLRSPEDARRFVEYWISAGATSFKAYMNISHEALAAAVETVHRHHLKITGHLCSVGFKEAANLGMDDLEHGLLVDTEFSPGKQPDVCPQGNAATDAATRLDLKGPQAAELFRILVSHHVAITSTLAVFEAFLPGRPPLQKRVLDALSTEAADHYLSAKERMAGRPEVAASISAALKQEMRFEREFVTQDGLLLAGCDPTGNGGALPGFGDQRNLELLVEAGFTPEQAIQIYSSNAARYLGREDHIGTIAPNKQADLVVVNGDVSAHIENVEQVLYVIKKGVVFDSAKLIESVAHKIGPE
jgi:imidazolonepropionase-like amidohydrolase